VEQLDHQTSKSLECSRDADGWADFDQNAFSGVDVDLELAGLVDGRVQECKQALDVEVSSPKQSALVWDM
jgi:hypothetical protein